ncbi:Tigger transposable element-derived protein 6 [Oopsacas minuta]|uniref:Tigger transposable element-derived protein 6 n=1 Tax=Oopsacas minuta TaxID=111878 RepID=A0AAV7JW03_9METZ|nr:Tigger transposable element-derived protein 6 [Oopsacas minuta]
MSLKRKNLTISEKLNVIEFASTHSQRDVADRFGISVGAVNNILKKKQEIQMACEENCNLQMKRVRLSSHCEVNDLIWQWFVTARSKNIPISGPILQAKGIDFAEQLGIPFKASNGWLEKFRSRYNIAFKTLCGESASVDPGTVDTWKQQLHTIIGGYSPEDIFNCDETGLYYKVLPTKSLVEKNKICNGTKTSKDRLTILLCANMSGTEKLKLLMIGKSQNPRCFKHMDFSQMPVQWKANKKAWMDSSIFGEWLKDINNKMKRQKRKILVFIDNATSHPHSVFSNIELKFFPANCTSQLQPMDQGIIQSMKLSYRKILLMDVLSRVESCDSGQGLIKSITVKHALYWAAQAWENVKSETIQKCFAIAGFGFYEHANLDHEENIQNMIDDLSSSLGIECCSGINFMNIDEEEQLLHAYTDDDWETQLIENYLSPADNETLELDEESDSDIPISKAPTVKEVLYSLDVIKTFSNNDSKVFGAVMKAESAIKELISEGTCQRQSKLTDYLEKIN